MPAWSFLEQGGKRACLVWHRRAGKDALSINWCATACFQRVGLYWHVLPTYEQGRKIVWDGITKDGRRFLSAFPGFDTPGDTTKGIVKRKRDDRMQLELINGSMFQVVGTDDVDRLVGPNPIGVVFSEYSLHNPAAWDLIRPILMENGGWAIFIYTMRGKNHGYRLYQMAKNNPDWFAENLTVDDTRTDDGRPLVTQEDIQAERDAGMPEETIQQEFYNDPHAALVGAYYKDQMRNVHNEGRVTVVPWEPSLPVDTFWDIGVNDTTDIIFTQRLRGEIRIIDFYENSGKGMQDYIKVLHELPYVYGEHWGPHDMRVREFGSGARSRIQIAQSLGVRFNVAPKLPMADGISAVRAVLPLCWFSERKTARLVEALREYERAWDTEKMVYANTPKHNWASHPADAFRQMAVVYRAERGQKPAQTQAINDYDPIGDNNQHYRQGANHIPLSHREIVQEYDPLSYR